MSHCCSFKQSPRSQRRRNGLQLPLHCQQVLGWIVFITTAIINFTLLVPIQFQLLKQTSEIIFILLYVLHFIFHLSALLIDPSENELRKLKLETVPEFDRNVHAHVIENGRCHLCNVFTTSKKTKHCSVCNKCVDQFDHHCKWLNNCIGRRNYAVFIASVVTALLIATFTMSLCLTDVVYFFQQPYMLSPAAQHFINCTELGEYYYDKRFCKKSLTFLISLLILCIVAFAISCALFHLSCFHVYISYLGLSTYEYIVSNNLREHTNTTCRNPTLKRYTLRNAHDNKDTAETNNSEANGFSVIKTKIRKDFDKTKNIFLLDKNKVHPDK